MTTEEIIKGLESVKTECGRHLDEGFAWICKPIDEAIKALKREHCTDAVSREEAVKVLRADPSFICTGDKAQAITDILSLPSVTPERPKGKWLIPYGSYSYWRTIYRCSLCGYETENNSNYCPNCGDYKRG